MFPPVHGWATLGGYGGKGYRVACYDDYSPVCREEVDALARRLRLKLFRTSVKENFNVEQGGWGSEKGREGSGVEEEGWMGGGG